jgi:hypothetical protein
MESAVTSAMPRRVRMAATIGDEALVPVTPSIHPSIHPPQSFAYRLMSFSWPFT